MASEYVSTGGPIEVPFSDDVAEVRDDELIVDSDKPGDSPEVKAQRATRRKERAAERERERKEQGEQLVQLRKDLEQERAERARLQGYVQALPTAQSQPGKDPYQEALDKVYDKQGESWAAYQAELKAGTLDEKRVKHYERVSRDLEEQKGRIHARQVVDADVARQRQEAAQQPYVHKYPDVYNNPAAFEYAKAEHAKRNARARITGEQITNETVDEIMEETRTVFKLGKKPAPSRSERDRFSGGSAGGTGGGNGGGDTGRGIAPTKELMKMAIARYGGPGVSDEKAFQLWVDSAGRELRKNKVL